MTTHSCYFQPEFMGIINSVPTLGTVTYKFRTVIQLLNIGMLSQNIGVISKTLYTSEMSYTDLL